MLLFYKDTEMPEANVTPILTGSYDAYTRQEQITIS